MDEISGVGGRKMGPLTCTDIASICSLSNPIASFLGGLSKERRSWTKSCPESVPTSNDAPSAVKDVEVNVALKSIVLKLRVLVWIIFWKIAFEKK